MGSREVHSFEAAVDEAWPSNGWCGSHVLLAVSGGADSVAMLHATAALKKRAGGAGRLFAAHLNHGLRGAESDADAQWVRSLCERLQVPLELEKLDVALTAQQQGDGWEAAARTMRYEFLSSTAERLGVRYVAVAHTADDQIETVLHRILRGTGIHGLRGMQFARPLAASVALVRPLLEMKRRQVIDYLADIGQDFRTDTSNTDMRFTRNRLRHELLPLLRTNYNADIDEALLRLAAQAEAIHQLVGSFVGELAAEMVTVEFPAATSADERRQATSVQIDCRRLADKPAVVIREVCRHAWDAARWPQQGMGFEQWRQLASLVAAGADSTPNNLPGNLRASRRGTDLAIEALG
jgi:tRNA(Ile)-lysidine synthase